MIANRWPRVSRNHIACLLLLLFGLVFFWANASLQLASDDLGWLLGDPPTVFDHYRQIPRISFAFLHAMFGSSAAAALTMIFLFHLFNALLVYRLGQKLLIDPIAAWVAVAVFLINPITLKTLTWISCFSYVQGTSLALLSLLAAWAAGDARGARRCLWSVAALVTFAAGLFCSHEILFLPVLFFAFGLFRGDRRGGLVLSGMAMALALLVNDLVYNFQRYGIEASKMFTFDFASAYVSSSLSSGLALTLAYPISLFARTQGLLRICFAEPLRWGMTALLWVVGILFAKDHKGWRLLLTLVLAFVALITPYIMRLYLTPDTANFDISYVLSGRVFYLPFVVIALILGWSISHLWRALQARRGAWLLILLPLIAYVHALWLYDKTDFLGLNVVTGTTVAMPPRWNPYTGQQPFWFLLTGLVVIAALALRVAAGRRQRVSASSAPSLSDPVARIAPPSIEATAEECGEKDGCD
jgi:hypothetical protein